MKSKFRLFFPCYFSFFVNGAMVLLVGAILPYIIEEAGINYSVAGGFLSAFVLRIHFVQSAKSVFNTNSGCVGSG